MPTTRLSTAGEAVTCWVIWIVNANSPCASVWLVKALIVRCNKAWCSNQVVKRWILLRLQKEPLQRVQQRLQLQQQRHKRRTRRLSMTTTRMPRVVITRASQKNCRTKYLISNFEKKLKSSLKSLLSGFCFCLYSGAVNRPPKRVCPLWRMKKRKGWLAWTRTGIGAIRIIAIIPVAAAASVPFSSTMIFTWNIRNLKLVILSRNIFK